MQKGMIVMRRVFVLVLLVFTMAFTAPVQAQSNFEFNNDFSNDKFANLTASVAYYGYVVNIRTFLSLRESPSIYSRELARIPNGTRLTVMFFENSNTGDFYRVRYNGMSGYAHKNYIQIDYNSGH